MYIHMYVNKLLCFVQGRLVEINENTVWVMASPGPHPLQLDCDYYGLVCRCFCHILANRESLKICFVKNGEISNERNFRSTVGWDASCVTGPTGHGSEVCTWVYVNILIAVYVLLGR